MSLKQLLMTWNIEILKNDESISKILIYFGINFSNFVEIINDKFVEGYLFKNKILTGANLDEYENTMNVLYAAWPNKEDFAYIDDVIDTTDIKNLMKQYFPWRLGDDGEINYIHNTIFDLEH